MRKKNKMLSLPNTLSPKLQSKRRSARQAAVTIFLGALALTLPACSRTTVPPEEKVPPATVKWEAPLQGALEEWTELVGTTAP
jgi:hypothetical protein